MSQSVTFLYLQQEDVIACGGLDMAATMAAVEKAFSLYDRGEVMEPQAPVIRWGGLEGRRVTMHPAWVGGDQDIMGIKWIPSNPENPVKLGLPRSNALTIINDPHSGYPLAVMDGKVISDMRTGAVAGVGARYLARPGADTVALLGAGPIARTQLMAVHVALPVIRQVRVYDTRQENAARFADEESQRLGLTRGAFFLAESAKEAVSGADVVCGATNAGLKDRYLEPGWLRPGTLLVNTSVNDPTFAVVQEADLVVVDSHKQFQAEGTVLVACKDAGLLDPDQVVEIGSIINGEHPGRNSPEDLILFSPLGMGMNDIINAKRVYENALEMGKGVHLKLWDAPVWV